jgi:hypothetical protein
MAAIKISEGNNMTKNVQNWFAASLTEMNAIATTDIIIGSVCYIYDGANKGEIYIAKSDKSWVIQ